MLCRCSVSTLTVVFLASLVGVGWCDVIIKIGLVEFLNPNGHDWFGNDCEMAHYAHACDHQFTICIGGPDNNDCLYKEITTRMYENRDAITFDSFIGEGLENPFHIRRSFWEGAFNINITAVEVDNEDTEVVDQWHLRYDLAPEAERLHTIRPRQLVGLRKATDPAVLDLKVAVYCEEHFYGPNCAVYCRSAPELHYTCDPDTGKVVCRAGWESDFEEDPCEAMSDDCLFHSCQNGGSCVDLERNYSCMCPDGFAGRDCEMNINECQSQPCQHGGTCYDLISSFMCMCAQGFHGDHCQHSQCPRNVATGVTCLNGGTCVADGECLCTPDYKGRQCETDSCHGVTCDHGQCRHGACVCLNGFTGAQCELEACHPTVTTCLNGATCIDGRCACASGYTGVQCEKEINACLSRPCHHEGTCVKLVGGYQCRCLKGYNGTNCEIYASTDSSFGIPQLDFQAQEDDPQSLPAYGVALLVVLFALALLVLVAVVLRHWFSRFPTVDKEEIRRNSDFDNPLRHDAPPASSYDNPNNNGAHGTAGVAGSQGDDNQPVDQIRRGSVLGYGVTHTKEFENPIYKMQYEPDVTSIKQSDDVVVGGQPVPARVPTNDGLEREPDVALDLRK